MSFKGLRRCLVVSQEIWYASESHKVFLRGQAGNILEFMLTRRGIDANPDKYKTTITMSSPTNVKEVQQLIGCLTALFCFLSYVRDMAFLLFAALKKKERF